jgi:hypothetical protein
MSVHYFYNSDEETVRRRVCYGALCFIQSTIYGKRVEYSMRILPYLIFVFSFSTNAEAFYGTLGRDQCAYPSTSFPTSQTDYKHAANVQIQALVSQKQQMEAQLARLSQDGLRLQAALRAQINAPWVDAMFAHMDNGLDCCAPTGVYAILDDYLSKGRRPAGNTNPEYEEPYQETTNNSYQPVDPLPENPPPVPYTPPIVAQPTNTSCQGYPAQYCSTQWGQTYSQPQTRGGQCLQTGFAATPAWYQAACRNGGKIDQQVCSHPQIAKNPADYASCMQNLSSYQNLSVQKRTLASNVYTMNYSISSYQSNPQAAYSSSSETKTSSFLSGIGNFLGSVVTTIGPVILDQYLSYRAQKNARPSYHPGSQISKYGPPRPVNNVNGQSSHPGTLLYSQTQTPPPFYGPKYGYGFNYGGNYGATVPGYQQGGFGCSQGVLGAGQNLLASLLSGGANLSLNANVQSRFGPNGGYAPYQAYLQGYGNQYSGIPPQNFPGYTPPYQPGGIYGTTPVSNPSHPGTLSYQAVPNYYSNNVINNPRPSYIPPVAYNPNVSANFQPSGNYQYNSYFYAQQMNNQQRLAQNEALLRQRQAELNYQANQLRSVNTNFSFAYPQSYLQNQPQYFNANYQRPPYLGGVTTGQQNNMSTLLQSLLGGGAQLNFNVQGNSY